jgi:hypothetical protein
MAALAENYFGAPLTQDLALRYIVAWKKAHEALHPRGTAGTHTNAAQLGVDEPSPAAPTPDGAAAHVGEPSAAVVAAPVAAREEEHDQEQAGSKKHGNQRLS